MSAPSPFSQHKPKLQIVVDSTSIGALQQCARFYQLAILEGYRGSKVDLEFGGYFAKGVEIFKKARAEGKSRDEAQLLAVKEVVEGSWVETANDAAFDVGGYPWGGNYEAQWRCLGTSPYKNAKGNKAKCPWSHKGKWHPEPAPNTCGECGSDTETVRRYNPGNPAKNRHTLVRLMAWYCEEQPENLSSGLHTYVFPNGKPAVELSWKLPLPFQNKYGETYILAGHLDSIMTNGLETFVSDNKTTKNALLKTYWKRYEPNTQVDIYDLAGSLLFPELGLRGVMIEAAQTLVDGARFGSHIFYRTEAQREELLNELGWWLGQAERHAEENYWPMNRKNCAMCPFQGICSKPPSERERYLKADFNVEHWNPLEER